jgi:hypothetical protein
LLAVAQRPGIVSVYETVGASDTYRAEPSCTIFGPQSQLSYTDGVAFVPPDDLYLAACNGHNGTITFHRRLSHHPLRYKTKPDFVLKSDTLVLPDGFGFSSCGQWLVSANHTSHCFSVFRRQKRLFSRKIKFDSKSVNVMSAPDLRHPHSAVFTPGAGHIIGTLAGSNFFVVYASRTDQSDAAWTNEPVARITTNDPDVFRLVNSENAMEGGPKGVFADKNRIVVCNPEFGIKIFAYRETA